MEPEGSLLLTHLSLSWASLIHSMSPHPTPWRFILILSSHLRLGLPIDLFPSGFPTKTLYTHLPFPIHAKATHTHTHTLSKYNVHCFPTATLVTRRRLSVTYIAYLVQLHWPDLVICLPWGEDVTLGRIHCDKKYGTGRRSEVRRGCLLSISLKKLQLSWKFLLRRDFIDVIRILFARFEVFVSLVSEPTSVRNRFLTFRESGFGGLEIACWPLVPKSAGSHPAEAVGFLRRNIPKCYV